MPGAPRVVGILAGAGTLPREIADEVRAAGGRVHIVALSSEAGDDFGDAPVTKVGWAQTGGMLRAFRNAGCTELVIVGAVRRPDLAALKPDLGFFTNLPGVLNIVVSGGGDDSVLGRVVRFFESKGFKVVAPGTVAPGLIVREGPVGTHPAAASDMVDIARGFDVVRALGPFDVGQAVVVSEGQIEAIEAAENTDAMLARIARQRGSASGGTGVRRGVLVKRPKPGQEMRVDMPAVGPATIDGALRAGLRGIAVLADGTLAADRRELARRADEGGIFVVGAIDRGVASVQAFGSPAFVAAGSRKPGRRHLLDAAFGAAALHALKPYRASGGIVVDRGHVLAIECGEGIAALVARGGALRQWGQRRLGRRSAVAVLADVPAAALEMAVAAAASAGLAGVAVLGAQPPDSLAPAVTSASRHGLFLIGAAAAAGDAL
jgi:DUF1009 family protein